MDFSPSGLVDGFFGQNNASIEDRKLDTARSDEERALGLEARGQQSQLNDMLFKQAQGQGPSVALAQQQAGLAQAQQAAAAQAAGARGVNRAFMQRSALNAGSQMAGQANQQAAQLRAQEQLNAQGQLGGNLNAVRTGDLQARQVTTGQEQANLDAQLAADKARQEQAAANAAGMQKGIGTVMSMASMSDQTMKSEITPVSATEALEALTPAKFRYSEKAVKKGVDSLRKEGADETLVDHFKADRRTPRLGIMAQDLEKTRAGREVVKNTPAGKVLDQGRALSLLLAAQAGMAKKLASLGAK